MDITAAEQRDADRIRQIAEQSFQTSYSLSPGQIETILTGVFSDDAVAERIESDSRLRYVAKEDGEAIGFADVKRDDQLFLRWLHVDPDYRGQGAGTALFEYVRNQAVEQDMPLVGRALVEGGEGKKFCEQFGFKQGEKTKLEFDEETFFGYTYVEPSTIESVHAEHAAEETPDTVTVEGTTLYIASDEETPGIDGPFFRVYEEQNGEGYGYLCSNCGSVDVGSDSLGRIECQNCETNIWPTSGMQHICKPRNTSFCTHHPHCSTRTH